MFFFCSPAAPPFSFVACFSRIFSCSFHFVFFKRVNQFDILKKSNGYGVGREITVRAPLREDRDEADKDGDDLLDAYEEGGYEAVRKLQRELKTKGR